MPDNKNDATPDVLSTLNLMNYRLEALEKKFDETLDKIGSKIDQLIERHNDTKEKQALDTQAIVAANEDIKVLDKRVRVIERDIVNVRVSMAQKLAYGGLGGGLAAGLMKLLELAVS